MYRVNFYQGQELVSSIPFRSHTVAMRRAKIWIKQRGLRSTVALNGIEFAFFATPMMLK